MPEELKYNQFGFEKVISGPMVQFYPRLATAFRSINAALFLQAAHQLWLLYEEPDQEWVPMCAREIWLYSNLNRYRQGNAIKKLVELGVLEAKTEGTPLWRYFRIDYEKLSKYLTSGFAYIYCEDGADVLRKLEYSS